MGSERMLGLDALRAAAVVAVIAAHLPTVAPGFVPPWGRGLTGVNAFFALSGFLVGGIALREIHQPRDALRFWVRRWTRTIPAAWCVLLICALIGSVDPLRVLGTATFTSFMQGYERAFMEHYWSLAVEEWAYLLLPAVVLALRAKRPLPWLVALWAALVVARDGVLILSGARVEVALFATPLRLDAILIGVVMAAAMPSMSADLRKTAAYIGVFGIVVLHVVQDMRSQFTLMPAMFALTLPALAAWRPAGTHVGWQVSNHIASLSYGLYLTHLPIFFYASLAGLDKTPAGAVLAVAASWLAALALRRYVERPIRASRDAIERSVIQASSRARRRLVAAHLARAARIRLREGGEAAKGIRPDGEGREAGSGKPPRAPSDGS